MKSKHIRAFYIGRQLFHVTDRGDGALQVSSIHPYDETDYHWAYQASKSCWHICREGRKVSVVASMDGSEITPETVAQFLLQADNDARGRRMSGCPCTGTQLRDIRPARMPLPCGCSWWFLLSWGIPPRFYRRSA